MILNSVSSPSFISYRYKQKNNVLLYNKNFGYLSDSRKSLQSSQIKGMSQIHINPEIYVPMKHCHYLKERLRNRFKSETLSLPVPQQGYRQFTS